MCVCACVLMLRVSRRVRCCRRQFLGCSVLLFGVVFDRPAFAVCVSCLRLRAPRAGLVWWLVALVDESRALGWLVQNIKVVSNV